MTPSGEQSKPVMAGSDDASDEAKKNGIFDQVRQDHAGKSVRLITDRLRERFRQANVPTDPQDIAGMAKKISETHP